MTKHRELKTLPYSADKLFDLVSSVDLYSEFIPWCMESRITSSEGDTFFADLVIGYKMVREKFSSKVVCKDRRHIHIDYISGPMKYLKNDWGFSDNEDGSCTIDFYVEFEFKNFMFQKLAGVFFDEAFKRMVSAFETRAQEVYGSSEITKP